MNESYPYYYNLYCVNLRCNSSIYHNIKETELPFTEENLLTIHSCSVCSQQLVSGMEMEIEQMTAGAGIKLPNKTFNSAN
ncbi:MAG: hypothetical protein JWQ66_1626 [Mucilaginibacter sp.]|nr:hypothetical protein [Mucilaginibacter sp.]